MNDLEKLWKLATALSLDVWLGANGRVGWQSSTGDPHMAFADDVAGALDMLKTLAIGRVFRLEVRNASASEELLSLRDALQRLDDE